MYAVVASGGKQYRVQEGDTLKIEKIPGEVGTDVAFDQVLMVSDGDDVKIGQPVLENAVVNGTIIEQGKGRKNKDSPTFHKTPFFLKTCVVTRKGRITHSSNRPISAGSKRSP